MNAAPERVAARILALDVIRAVAILLVLGAHLPDVPGSAWGHWASAAWKRSGWAGVDLFFALSGFLIMGLLLGEQRRTGAIDSRAFVLRRIAKIYPSYLLLLCAVSVWAYRQGDGFPPEHLGSALVHLQNYFPMPRAPHLWSLAMEEHCYAVLLVLALMSGRGAIGFRRPWIVPLALITLFLASWSGRWAYALWGYGGSGPIGFTYTHQRLDAVLAGSLAAWIVIAGDRWAPERRRAKAALMGTAVLCFLPTLVLEPYEHRVFFLLAGLPLQAAGFACLLLVLAVPSTAFAPTVATTASAWTGRHHRATGSRRGPIRLLAFIGVSSYSTYLWHLPFAGELNALLTGSAFFERHALGPLLRLLCFVALSLGIGATMYALVEKPALVWGRRRLALRARRREGVFAVSQAGAV